MYSIACSHRVGACPIRSNGVKPATDAGRTDSRKGTSGPWEHGESSPGKPQNRACQFAPGRAATVAK
jgi:hypothetical protein